VSGEPYSARARRQIEAYVEEARGYLEERDAVREKAIKASRDIVKLSGWAITEVHKGDIPKALEYIAEMEERVREFLELVRPYPELYYSGMANNALSEYAEAEIFLAIVQEKDIPGPRDLDITPVPYLQGLGDVVGELRRLVLEKVRTGDFEGAWRLFDIMEGIYLSLRSLDFPDALAPGVRHKADVARRLTDDTKAFLIDLSSRYRLASLLERSTK